eukprot:gnl/MRDRNA2_/MRDRNA2_86560_c0_seq6.p1 gnl/MRDRNA2_/MRDRNA2_86560_c0~~gnl/MRDRNA2_/MRDRNA2_86560_c0_seq6.p1  ORF type:complete len:391 (+),score=68.35 gnl/MRDRNA2_/MRDRNA2_86560_c0_seq6:30-1175(+)
MSLDDQNQNSIKFDKEHLQSSFFSDSDAAEGIQDAVERDTMIQNVATAAKSDGHRLSWANATGMTPSILEQKTQNHSQGASAVTSRISLKIPNMEIISSLVPAVDPCQGRRPCRGLAGCVGKGSEWMQGYATLQALRSTGNADPVQIFHVDGELSPQAIVVLESVEGVKVHDLKDVLTSSKDIRKHRGYTCLSMALLVSSFDHVMTFAGDGLYFSDPAPLWSNNQLKHTGALFVYDRRVPGQGGMCDWLKSTAIPWMHDTLKVPSQIRPGLEQRREGPCIMKSDHEQCSNQVFLDKTREDTMQALGILYNLQEAFYAFPAQFTKTRRTKAAPVWGEKEFYWMACELAGAACVDSFMENSPLTIGTSGTPSQSMWRNCACKS